MTIPTAAPLFHHHTAAATQRAAHELSLAITNPDHPTKSRILEPADITRITNLVQLSQTPILLHHLNLRTLQHTTTLLAPKTPSSSSPPSPFTSSSSPSSSPFGLTES